MNGYENSCPVAFHENNGAKITIPGNEQTLPLVSHPEQFNIGGSCQAN